MEAAVTYSSSISKTATAQRLKESLVRIMSSKGYEYTTISDIIRDAGLSRTAFYYNYQDKDEMLNELFEDMQDGIVRSIIDSWGNKPEVNFEREPSLLKLFSYVSEHNDFFRLLYLQPAMLMTMYSSLVKGYSTDIRFVPILEDSSAVDFIDTARYFAIGVMSFLGYWVKNRGIMNVEEVSSELAKVNREKVADWFFVPSSKQIKVFAQQENSVDRRIERTRQAIQDAFLSLLGDSIHIEQLTVKHIAEKANIRRATFYAHYESKDRLIEDMMNVIIQNIVLRLVCEQQGSIGRLTALVQSVERLIVHLQSNAAFFCYLFKHTGLLTVFVARLLEALNSYYSAQQANVNFARETYVFYCSSMMLLFIMERIQALLGEKETMTPALLASKYVRLFDQKQFQIIIP